MPKSQDKVDLFYLMEWGGENMLIRTQKERKDVVYEIINALDLYITPNGKKGCYMFARLTGATIFTESQHCVAIYATKEEATAELDMMVSYFEANPNGIYKIR